MTVSNCRNRFLIPLRFNRNDSPIHHKAVLVIGNAVRNLTTVIMLWLRVYVIDNDNWHFFGKKRKKYFAVAKNNLNFAPLF